MSRSRTPIDAYQTITDQIIAAIEAGTPPWRKPWIGGGGGMPLRFNGQPYQGVNVLALWCAAMAKGFSSDTWMTFRQARELGGCVRKGETAAHVVKYGTIERDDDESAKGEDAGGDARVISYAKVYSVFNVDQIDGLPADYAAAPVDTGARPLPAYQTLFDRLGADITHGGGRACYRPGPDDILMPPVERFESAEAYCATLAHELVHWTGHRSRLDRELSAKGRDAYAFEELIAEIGACFFGARIGLAPEIDQSAAYVAAWLETLREDKRAIFRAAAAAQRAADLLAERSGVAGQDADAAPLPSPMREAAA